MVVVLVGFGDVGVEVYGNCMEVNFGDVVVGDVEGGLWSILDVFGF